ncbi:MAG TPA: amino acid permease, partial [Planctomycetota bacterium]|nr:amino acid permease [Planctomycetota bacterium]
MSVSPATSQPSLQRVVGLPGAVLLGLGSILGTGVFVSLGISAGVAGTAMLPAILVAGGVALLNGLSSAQLAAAYPVSGGTYEYGYRLIGPRAGFAAGWMFLCAKSASAATGALGLAGYLLNALGVGAEYLTGLALGLVLATTFLVAGGMQRSARANTWIVGTTLLGLLAFVAGAFW